MHLEPTPEAVAEMIERLPAGGFIMLNLFRLREPPDFSKHPELEPETPLSSRDLFDRYAEKMHRRMAKIGAERIFLAEGSRCLIGPSDERWDVVQMVRYSSRQAFLDLAGDPAVQEQVPLREIMLEDSRVMPMFEQPLDRVTR